MVEKTVLLSNFTTLKEFVETVLPLEFDVRAVSGGKQVNAKVITELFSFDLTKPVTVIADTTSIAAFTKLIKPFSID